MICYSEALQSNNLIITLRSLQAQNEGSEIVLRILLECGENREERRLVLTASQYCELKPQKGVLSEEAFEQLEAAAELCRAIRAGESLMSYGSNTAGMLTQKLWRRGFMRATAIEAAEYLKRTGVIDETRDLQRELEKCLRKLWGAKRINAHLWSKGFDMDAMSELPDFLSEIDFEENCASLIRKHYGEVPRDREEQRRMIAFLSRYGYSLDEIRCAMRKLSD